MRQIRVGMGVGRSILVGAIVGWGAIAVEHTSVVAQSSSSTISQTTPNPSQQEILTEAEQLNQQVLQLYGQGQYAAAIPLAQRALAIREQVLGPEHRDVATSLNDLAVLYRAQGNYVEAEPLFQRAIAIIEKALGPGHPDVATSLDNLAGLYYAQGNYAKAESLFQRAITIAEQTLGSEHPFVAISLNNLAELYHTQGKYIEAEALYKRALAIDEQVSGPEHPDIATGLNNLAALYSTLGNYTEAELLYQRALKIRKQVLGSAHPDVAQSLNNLAALYSALGNYTEAELLYQRALKIRKQVLGPAHPDVAQSLNNLAELYGALGNYTEAEPLHRRALKILEQTLGSEHLLVATSSNNLAGLYHAQRNYSEAETLYKRALTIREQALGLEHPDVATSLNNLAELYRAQGNYAKAAPLQQRALKILEHTLGPKHPSVATGLNNLALLYDAQEKHSEAKLLHQHALTIREQVLGLEHPLVATSLNNLSLLHDGQGNVTRAIELRIRAANIEEQNLDLILATGSEARKQAYMATLSGEADATVFLHLQKAPQNAQAARLAIITVLRRKGRILDVLTNSQQILRQRLTSDSQSLLDNLFDTRRQLAALIFNQPEDLVPEQYQTQITALHTRIGQLEDQLSRRSSEFRSLSQSADLEFIQELIPANAALVELFLYHPLNTKASPQQRFGEPRYAAYILRPQGNPQGIDLGEAKTINTLIASFRDELQDPATDNIQVKQAAQLLDAHLMQPVRKLLGETRTILIAPDSALNLVPFEALVDENDRYLVETYNFTYLTSGRDLLRLQTQSPSEQPPLLLADPYFDRPGEITATQLPQQPSKPDQTRSIDLSQKAFAPLPGTAREVEAIAARLGVKPLIGTQATEDVVKQVNSPSILHIATHGFFENAPRTELDNKVLADNPLLLSGLVLAGVKAKQQSTQEDGILSALEVTTLDLVGTKLVTLSACDTGLGGITAGEGIYGLRRALVIAGSESQLISLWKVEDEATEKLMVSYYERLQAGKGRSEALKLTQLEMLQSETYQHPYYWASFILSGNWEAIDEQSLSLNAHGEGGL